MRKTKRLNKRSCKRNKTTKKYKKGGNFLKNMFFGKKEPDLTFRNAMSENDQDYIDFKIKQDEIEKKRREYEDDRKQELMFLAKNGRIQPVDEDDLNPENFANFINTKVTAGINKKQMMPTDEDRMRMAKKSKRAKQLRFGEERSTYFNKETEPSEIPNVRSLYPGVYGGRKNNTRKRKLRK